MSSKLRRTPLFGYDGNLGIPIIPPKNSSNNKASSSTTTSHSSSTGSKFGYEYNKSKVSQNIISFPPFWILTSPLHVHRVLNAPCTASSIRRPDSWKFFGGIWYILEEFWMSHFKIYEILPHTVHAPRLWIFFLQKFFWPESLRNWIKKLIFRAFANKNMFNFFRISDDLIWQCRACPQLEKILYYKTY